MKHTSCLLYASVLILTANGARGDTFGTGLNAFTVDFVTIGNEGNADDAGAGGGLYSSPYGGVGYNYRMAVTEVPEDWIVKATALGLTNVDVTGGPAARPARFMKWYEAAAFVNWLNTSTGHQAAYDLTFSGGWVMNLWASGDAWQADGQNLYRHKDAYYFLPSEDEWYKAAFHQNDGATANYWDYATGGNAIPGYNQGSTFADTAIYNGGPGAPSVPADVTQSGGLSPYGTRGQNGNVFEWQESALDGVNDSISEARVIRGGAWASSDPALRSSVRESNNPSAEFNSFGFRVASVPEPSSALLLTGAGLGLLLRRRRG